MTETVPEARPLEGEMGPLARLAGVFFSPAKTFESIARKPGWILPVVLLLAWSAFGGYFIGSRLDVDAVVEKQVEAAESRGGTMSAEQVEGMRKGVQFFFKLVPVIGVLYLAVLLLVVPAIYHGVAAAWGKATRYVSVFSAYAHVQMVQLLKGVFIFLVAMPKQKIDPDAIPRLLKSNVGAYLDPETTHPALLALLTNLDVFDLWGVALCAMALSRVTRLGTKAAAIVAVSVWALYVLVVTAFAAIGAAFRG